MVLTASQIASAKIVVDGVSAGKRHTTYDATVGEILLEGKTLAVDEFDLPARGVVWVLSHEEFHLPKNVTGLATLRTTWTHDGVLALNVGVIDPGWQGPLTTALVNFSDKEFTVRKGEPFFRILFFEHGTTAAKAVPNKKGDYLRKMGDKSARTSSTFLNIKALATEVVDQVLITPRWLNKTSFWGVVIGFAALILAMIAIFVPIAYGVSSDWAAKKEQVEQLRAEVGRLKNDNENLAKSVEELRLEQQHARGGKATGG